MKRCEQAALHLLASKRKKARRKSEVIFEKSETGRRV